MELLCANDNPFKIRQWRQNRLGSSDAFLSCGKFIASELCKKWKNIL